MARFTFTPNGFYNSNPSWTTQDGVYTYVIRWNGVDYWEWTNWPYGGEPRNYTSPPAFPINGWALYNGTLTTEFNFTLGQCETPTPTPTITQTNTPTLTQTNTPGLSPSATQTNTPTTTQTPTNTQTATNTPTNTNTQTPTNTVSPTRTASQTPTNTRTMTNTPSRTAKETPLPTRTPTQTPTNTATQTPTNTTTITKSVTPTTTKTPTNTNTPTMTSTSPLNRIFYVSSGGSDSNTVAQAQSTSTPWKTFIGVNANMSSFQPGDQILFKRGEIFEDRKLIVTRSGIAGRPITFGAYGTGENPIFTYTFLPVTSPTFVANVLVQVQGRSYINFENLKFTDLSEPSVNTATTVSYCIKAESGSGFININNCEFSYVGIGLNCVANNCNFTNSFFTQGRMIRNTPIIVNPDDDFGGNPVVLVGSNNIVTGNTFTECWAQSYDYGRDGGAVEFFGVSSSRSVNNNLVAYNTFYHTNGWAEFGAEKILSGDSTAYNNKFYYNKIINCGGMYAHWQNPQPNGTTFSIKMSGTEFYNNILVINESDWRGTPIFDLRTNYPWSDVMLVKNNIFYVSGVTGETVYDSTLSGTALVHENNIYNLATGVTFSVSSSIPIDSSELRTTTVQWRSITGDSLNWDYRLLAGASAINFGTDVGLTRDFSGNTVTVPPDAGILEF
jgi:hypothetical protein